MPFLKLPNIIQKSVMLNTDVLQVNGATILDAIKDGCSQHEKLDRHFFYQNGSIKHQFLLSVNNNQVTADMPVNGDDTIEVMIATSGGIEQKKHSLSPAEVQRYSRHLILPEVGVKGQMKLRDSKVLIVGTGGLGAPTALYLAAMGIGEIGLVDFDTVEHSNLQRQIIHSLEDVGRHKVDSASETLSSINDLIKINSHKVRLDESNVMEIVTKYDVVVDGTDNFSSRYLVNDACVLANKPYIYGSILGFSGQVSVLNHNHGPCYRCLFPEPPAEELAPNCSANGVLGVLPGLIGTIQATETVKVLLNIGSTLSGRLLIYDALEMSFRDIDIQNNESCRICSNEADIKELQEYEEQCILTALEEESSYTVENNMTPKQVIELMKKNQYSIELIDLREPIETEICSIDGAQNIPLSFLTYSLDEMEKEKTYVLFCKTGERTELGANAMCRNGFTNVHKMIGGIVRWSNEIDNTMTIY